MNVEIIDKKYEYKSGAGLGYSHKSSPCAECGEMTLRVCKNLVSGEYQPICKKCQNLVKLSLPYPVKVTYRRNIKNTIGLGNNYYDVRLSKNFFDGLSNDPRKKQRVNLSSHTVYMSIEKARKNEQVNQFLKLGS